MFTIDFKIIFIIMNLRTINKYFCQSLDIDHNHTIGDFALHKIDLPINNQILTIDNLLSDNECSLLINNKFTKHISLKNEYLANVRNSSRFLNIDDNLAKTIYNRLKIVFDKSNFGCSSKPFGFGVDGVWKLSGVNPCFRHCLYTSPSVGFLPHRDSCYVQDTDNRSIYSLIIYLNDSFECGTTTFLKSVRKREIEDTVEDELIDGQIEIFKYKPKKGSAIIFNHDTIHSGDKVTTGSKYILRSDLIYNRVVNTNAPNWKNNPYYLKAIEYYREAGIQEMNNNIQLSSYLYNKGLALRQFH